MPGLVPGIHVFGGADREAWMAGHRRAEATPSFGRLCPAMTAAFSGDFLKRERADSALVRWPGPRFGTDLGVAATHQMHQLLRHRNIAVIAEAALLRHRPAIAGLLRLHLF